MLYNVFGFLFKSFKRNLYNREPDESTNITPPPPPSNYFLEDNTGENLYDNTEEPLLITR